MTRVSPSPSSDSVTPDPVTPSPEAEPVQVFIESSTRAGYWLNRVLRWFLRLSDGNRWLVGLGAIALVLTIVSIVLEVISMIVKLALLALLVLGGYRLYRHWRSSMPTG
jgi:hypothetical protein